MLKLVYCSNCGAQIADDAYFCSKCGTKTQAGKTAKVTYPSDRIEEIFYQLGEELEKALTLAAKETHAALKKASESFQQKSAVAQTEQAAQKDTMVCPNCGAKNVSGAIFCYICGKRIQSEATA